MILCGAEPVLASLAISPAEIGRSRTGQNAWRTFLGTQGLACLVLGLAPFSREIVRVRRMQAVPSMSCRHMLSFSTGLT